MKKQFSTHWLSSKQPRKQRKYKANAPLHAKHRFLNAHLSKELRKKYGKRAIPLRKGDEVTIMRGSFKKKKAKVTDVNLKKTKITLENMNRAKKDGTKVAVKFSPSALKIISLNLEDKERLKSIEKKSKLKETKNAPEKK